jgi:hypothetical protein
VFLLPRSVNFLGCGGQVSNRTIVVTSMMMSSRAITWFTTC